MAFKGPFKAVPEDDDGFGLDPDFYAVRDSAGVEACRVVVPDNGGPAVLERVKARSEFVAELLTKVNEKREVPA